MKNQSKYLFLALGLSIIFGNSAYGMGVMAKGLAAKFMQQSLINRITFGMSSLSILISTYTIKKNFEFEKTINDACEEMKAINDAQETQIMVVCLNVPKKDELTVIPDTDENEQAEKTQQQ
ncbi:hypothetical protein IPH25_04435 [bacterium]|nr:MAG: hypothetical protein IPG37_01430 [bacterium]QQR61693.1 MAG: hypothetical protein IPH25_04435 [bacterium]QQR62740.1 MAG: hypothetical protein IPH67_05005 [bacterium]